jgi:anti-sigma B factor antagonist
MATKGPRPSLQVEEIGKVWVVKCTTDALVDNQTVREFGTQLKGLVEHAHEPNVVVNFSGVQLLSSSVLGHLLGTHNKARTAGGRLVLCGIAPDLLRVFKITGMDRLLKIYPGEHEALQAF